MSMDSPEGIIPTPRTAAATGRNAPGCIVEEYALTDDERTALGTYLAKPVGEIVLGAYYLLDDYEQVDRTAMHFSHRLDDALNVLGVEAGDWTDAVVFERIGNEKILSNASRGIDQTTPDHTRTLGYYLAGVLSVDLADTSPTAPTQSIIVIALAASGFLLVSMEKLSETIGDSVYVSARIADRFSLDEL